MTSRTGYSRNESSCITMHSQRGEAMELNSPAPRRADEVIAQSLTIPEDLRGHIMVAPSQGLIDWARKNSLWPVTFGPACCAIENDYTAEPIGAILRCDLQRDAMRTVASVTSGWPGAEFMEREAFEIMGIRFVGHPGLRRILLPDEPRAYWLRPSRGSCCDSALSECFE